MAENDTSTRTKETVNGLMAHRKGDVAPNRDPKALDQMMSAVGYPTKLEIAVFALSAIGVAAFFYGLSQRVWHSVASLIALAMCWIVYRALGPKAGR